MVITFIGLDPPSDPSLTYTIFTAETTTSLDYFTIIEAEHDDGTYTVSHALTMDDGSALPSGVSLVDTGTELEIKLFSRDTSVSSWDLRLTATAIYAVNGTRAG